jgi:hypothetical protein
MKMLKKTSASVIVLLTLAGMVLPISRAATENSATKDMMPVFLSEVVGLDLTKYNITTDDYHLKYPSEYGGNVKDEHVYLDLASSEGTISVMGLFLNGFNGGIFVYQPTNGSVFFNHQPSTNAVDESRNILQRYKTFAQKYGLETSHIDQALTLLNNATKASASTDDLYTFNNITGFVPSVVTAGNMKQETKDDNIKWIYTDSGVEMPNKCLKVDFGAGTLHFVDTWNLYTVGNFSVVSEDEVKQIAFEAADNYDLTLVGENDTLIIVEKPEWSSVTSIVLNMVPGKIYNDELNQANPVVSGGNATRDPLALYPLWETVLYFSKNISNAYGIAVGVWGDTKEIAYITPYCYLGVPGGELDTTTSTEPSPEPTQSENPPQIENGTPFPTMYLIGGIGATAIIAIAATTVVLKKRRN